MTNNRFLALSSSVAAIAALLSSGTAVAQVVTSAGSAPQSAADDAAETDASGIGDIVVTAEKRVGTEQKTAIAMSVITADALAKRGAGSLTDIIALAPSVSLAQVNVGYVVAIRGVSSRDVTEIGDPAIALSIDGFTLQRAVGLNTAMFDLDRVEVLRGPQGTLLGRNATGGALNIITAKPVDHFAAYVGGELGGYNLYATKGMINLPVTDWLQLRAAFQTRDRDGYRDNAPAARGDDEHSRAGRISALLTPTDKLKVSLTAEYSQDNNHGPAVRGFALVRYTAANVPAGFLVGDVSYSPPARGSATSGFPIAPGGYLRYKNTNLRTQADYDLGFATLTYLGGYRYLDFTRNGNLGGPFGLPQQNYAFGQTEKISSWNHEVRLSSASTTPFKWQIGGFFFQEKNNYQATFTDDPGGRSLTDPKAGIVGAPFVLQRYNEPDVLSRTEALFGQASYTILDGLSVEGGIRYSQDQKSRTYTLSQINLGGYPACLTATGGCVVTTTSDPNHLSTNNTTYHAGINYQVTSRNLLYFKFDTGYKAGGFSNNLTYNPETISAFEIGAKNRFFGNKLQINIDAYLYNYTDQQVSQTILTTTGAIGTQVLNAGRSRYKGVELDAVFQPTPSDRLNLYVGYNHARFVNFATSTSGQLLRLATLQGRAVAVTAANGSVSYNFQLAGNTPPQAPDWSINAGYEHDFSVFGGTLTPRIQTHWESQSFFSIYNLPLDRQAAYSRSDIIVSFAPANKAWVLSAYVRNLENSLILANEASPPSGFFNAYREQYAPPRTFGANLTFNF